MKQALRSIAIASCVAAGWQSDPGIAEAQDVTELAAPRPIKVPKSPYEIRARRLAKRALEFLRAGKLRPAERTLRLALRNNPHNLQAWTALGLTLSWLNQPKAAADAFTQAIRLEPELAQLHFLKGSVLEQLTEGGAADGKRILVVWSRAGAARGAARGEFRHGPGLWVRTDAWRYRRAAPSKAPLLAFVAGLDKKKQSADL